MYIETKAALVPESPSTGMLLVLATDCWVLGLLAQWEGLQITFGWFGVVWDNGGVVWCGDLEWTRVRQNRFTSDQARFHEQRYAPTSCIILQIC